MNDLFEMEKDEAKAYTTLNIEERIKIKKYVDADLNMVEICTLLKRSRNTIEGEISRNGGKTKYDPYAAHEEAVRRMRDRFQSKKPEEVTTKTEESDLWERVKNIEMQLEILIETLNKDEK